MIERYDEVFGKVVRAESLPRRKLSKRQPIKKARLPPVTHGDVMHLQRGTEPQLTEAAILIARTGLEEAAAQPEPVTYPTSPRMPARKAPPRPTDPTIDDTKTAAAAAAAAVKPVPPPATAKPRLETAALPKLPPPKLHPPPPPPTKAPAAAVSSSLPALPASTLPSTAPAVPLPKPAILAPKPGSHHASVTSATTVTPPPTSPPPVPAKPSSESVASSTEPVFKVEGSTGAPSKLPLPSRAQIQDWRRTYPAGAIVHALFDCEGDDDELTFARGDVMVDGAVVHAVSGR